MNISDVISVIKDFNSDMAEHFYHAGVPDDGYPEMVTLVTDGDEYVVKVMGSYVCDSDNLPPIDADHLRSLLDERALVLAEALQLVIEAITNKE